jgi:small conductance mechanosensitive channel
MPDLTDLPGSVQIGFQLFLIVVVAVIGYLVLRAVVNVGVRHLLEGRRDRDRSAPPGEMERRVTTVGKLIVKIAGSVIAIIAVLMALDLFGIDIGPAIAGLGVVGIAVGLGAQTLVRDWLAGVFVLLENQYSQGDHVRIAGVEGTVEEFSLRRTTLREADGTVHSVPNGQIVVATNLSRGDDPPVPRGAASSADEAADPS